MDKCVCVCDRSKITRIWVCLIKARAKWKWKKKQQPGSDVRGIIVKHESRIMWASVWTGLLLEVWMDIVRQFSLVNYRYIVRDLANVYRVFWWYPFDEQWYEEDPKKENDDDDDQEKRKMGRFRTSRSIYSSSCRTFGWMGALLTLS